MPSSLNTWILLALVATSGAAAGALVGVHFLAGQAVPSAPLGDYGDAPDGFLAGYAHPFERVVGRFPTRYDTTNSRIGAHGVVVLNPGEAVLGLEVSSERGALDPGDSDGRQNMIDDDEYDDGLSINQPLPLYLNVTLRPGAETSTWYLNVLVDVNHDGEWRDEWFVKNEVLNLSPGQVTVVRLDATVPFPPAWMRIALTKEPIDESRFAEVGGWDGSGEFSGGEVEDYLFGVGAISGTGEAVEIVMDEIPPDVANRAAEAAARRVQEARAAVQSIAEDLREAQANATAIAEYYSSARGTAAAIAEALSEVNSTAQAAAEVAMTTECFTVESGASGLASAMSAASGYVSARAEYAMETLASARASAQSAVSALASARSAAEAAAEAIAEAEARAAAHAEAAAEAWAEATAHVRSHQVVGGKHFFTVSSSDLNAFLNAAIRAWIEASAAAEASAEAEAHAAAVASALAQAQAAVQAMASAQVAAETASNALARAEAAARALAQAASTMEAYVHAFVTEECCTFEPCPPCPYKP